MKKLNRFIISLFAAASLCMALSVTAFADSGKTVNTRGIVPVAYTQDYILWNCTPTQITTSDTYQKAGGLNFQNLGIQKMTTLSSATTWTFNCKNESTIGVNIGPLTLGPTIQIIDQVFVTSTGGVTWRYNI